MQEAPSHLKERFILYFITSLILDSVLKHSHGAHRRTRAAADP